MFQRELVEGKLFLINFSEMIFFNVSSNIDQKHMFRSVNPAKRESLKKRLHLQEMCNSSDLMRDLSRYVK